MLHYIIRQKKKNTIMLFAILYEKTMSEITVNKLQKAVFIQLSTHLKYWRT